MWALESEKLKELIRKLPPGVMLPMGQSGFIFSDGVTSLGIDLIISDLYMQGTKVSRRLVPPPFPVEDLPPLDVILVTHDHRDHLDTALLCAQARKNPGLKIIAPRHVLDALDVPEALKVRLSDYERCKIGSAEITAVPVAHMSYESSSPGYSRYYGYVVRIAGTVLFHSGDTISTDRLKEDLKRLGPFDYSMIPINGRDEERARKGIIGNTDAEEAIDLAIAAGTSVLIPCHFDLVSGNVADVNEAARKARGRIPVEIPVPGKAVCLCTDEERAMVRLAEEMVRLPSPSGGEEAVAKLMERKLRGLGFNDVNVDRYGSVTGVLYGTRPGKTILLDGHIDNVDVIDRELWEHDPWGAELDSGRIYGRGTSDMKASDAAMVMAAASFCGKEFSGRIAVSLTVHEECFEGIASREVSKAINPDFVIIGEATTSTVKTGQRGRAEVVVETEGVSCHSSNPGNGVNAVYEFMKALKEIRKIVPPEHPVLGKGILELTDIKSYPYPGASVLPSLCRATFDRRTLTGEDEESVLEPIRKALALSGVKGRCYIAEGEARCWTGETIKAKRFYPAWLVSEEEEAVKKALRGLSDACIDAGISHFSFCTNGSHYCGEKGITTIGYGPSLESLAHVRDEYIEVNELVKAYRGYIAILNALTE